MLKALPLQQPLIFVVVLLFVVLFAGCCGSSAWEKSSTGGGRKGKVNHCTSRKSEQKIHRRRPRPHGTAFSVGGGAFVVVVVVAIVVAIVADARSFLFFFFQDHLHRTHPLHPHQPPPPTTPRQFFNDQGQEISFDDRFQSNLDTGGGGNGSDGSDPGGSGDGSGGGSGGGGGVSNVGGMNFAGLHDRIVELLKQEQNVEQRMKLRSALKKGTKGTKATMLVVEEYCMVGVSFDSTLLLL